jgi:hypothetical protein
MDGKLGCVVTVKGRKDHSMWKQRRSQPDFLGIEWFFR